MSFRVAQPVIQVSIDGVNRSASFRTVKHINADTITLDNSLHLYNLEGNGQLQPPGCESFIVPFSNVHDVERWLDLFKLSY